MEVRDNNVTNYIVRFPRLPGIFDYLLRDFWTYFNLYKRLHCHYDLCILAHPRLLFVALRLKRLGKVDLLIYDDWDYFPGLFPKDVFWYRIMHTREQICVRNADGVTSVSHNLQEFREKQGARQIALVPNGVDYALFERARQKRDHPPTLLYMGTLADGWGADLPIMALPIIMKRIPNIRYLVIGTGLDEQQLQAKVSDLGLDEYVYFLGAQEYQHLPYFLAEADLGVAVSRKTEFREYACPLKIIEYMAAGLPVIGSKFGETQFMIEEANAGKTVEFSEQAFASTVIDLLTNQSEYNIHSANAVSFAKAYDWEQLLDQQFAFIERLDQLVHRELDRGK
jgi:glycosyltransferase involved in cell wall biosynthesis